MKKERMYNILIAPIISEKSSRIGELNNQFIFEVARDATKTEIREAVQTVFDVRVTSVQILNRRGKTKRFGRTLGKRVDTRKAFVRLHKDDDISFHEAV